MNQSSDKVKATITYSTSSTKTARNYTISPQKSKSHSKSTLRNSNELPLEQYWTLWLDKYLGPNLSVEKYEEALSPICTFGTIQSFWRWFNNLPTVNQLPARASYHLMQEGVKPLWEDPANQRGGTLCIKVQKQDTVYVWNQIVLAAIGEQFSNTLAEGDELCGITISMRRDEDMIKIWNRAASLLDPEVLFSRIKTLVPKVNLSTPTYTVHSRQVNSR